MRHEMHLKRSDGTEVRLISTGSFSVFTGKLNVTTFALVKKPEAVQWQSVFLSTAPKNMPRDEYMKEENRGLMFFITYAEFFKSRRGLETLLTH